MNDTVKNLLTAIGMKDWESVLLYAADLNRNASDGNDDPEFLAQMKVDAFGTPVGSTTFTFTVFSEEA